MSRLFIWMQMITLIFIIFPSSTFGQESTSFAERNSVIAFVGANRTLYLLDTSSADVTQLSDFFGVSTPSWSPDGRQIVFSNSAASVDIFVFDFETPGIEQLTTSAVGSFTRNVNPVWSPDGSHIAFASDRDGNWEIYVMNADGTNQARLTSSDSEDGLNGLTWSPDGNFIAYVRNIGTELDEGTGNYESQQLYLLDVGGDGSAINLTSEINACPAGEIYYNPTWSLTTDYLVYSMTCGGDGMDIYLMDMDDYERSRSHPTST